MSILFDKTLGDDLRSVLTAAVIGTAALVAGASLAVHSRSTPIPHSARADAWQMACRERCELKTIAHAGVGDGQWIGLVYVSTADARVIAGQRRPLGAAVTFDDGRRFVFDMCDDAACRLPPADSAALLQRLQTDDGGALRVRLASGGTTGLIDLPRLEGSAIAALLAP